jgi:predicted GIY-YIG superfamily endonuclease
MSGSHFNFGRRGPIPMPVKRAFVYIVRCADRTFYIGTAKDVQARLAVHNAGKGAKYTRPRLPVRVVWQEGPMSLTRALQREYQLKQLTRPQKQALIRGKLAVRRPR